ncbi:flagellar motor switch protein FliM [Pyrinomonas methylaliphatogenes]|uniref:Flagellar motor switch protein FliM n=1 Tax=Pyrinomonas methylaliphatogenes TaxID=454194 RepID=A0A0B6WWJ1_9BACT|nr:flagellar motor switch protein FliM [Pyrinomonas methylaliphatogenes]MBX5477583.1 flagellar motor switch protein FliM [Pyrinomonas methylaliphatogenes]CDM65653.1 flagellar motor switch protein FliM [Pyrinomonas methylaliphatogenes]
MHPNEIVTKEEMSALLGTTPEVGASDKRPRVVPYNFRRPDRLSKEQVRSLYLLHDLFSNSLSSSVPVFLRTISEVTLLSVEQQAYVEYLYGLPDPTAIFTLSMSPLQGVAVIEINPSIAFPIIDRMLGGPGLPLSEQRAVTEIEQKILEGFLKLVTDDLREAWRPLVELDLQIVGRETRPQMLQIVAPNEVVLSIIFHMQIGEARGHMSLCIPAVTLEPIVQKFNRSLYARNREIPPEQTRALLDTLAQVAFPIAAEARGTKVSMEDLLRIAPGDILKLDHPVDRPIEVSVGGAVKFYADLIAHRGRKAIHLRARVCDESSAAQTGAIAPEAEEAVSTAR